MTSRQGGDYSSAGHLHDEEVPGQEKVDQSNHGGEGGGEDQVDDLFK